jgi:hypothetical protein
VKERVCSLLVVGGEGERSGQRGTKVRVVEAIARRNEGRRGGMAHLTPDTKIDNSQKNPFFSTQ